jgi:hypothetical protein
MKPIIIVAIRSNVNWLEMNKKKFFAQGNTPITRNIFMPEGNWLLKHWKYIKLWDSILNEKYFHVRNKLQRFSEKTHSNIHNLDIVIKGKDSIFQFVKKYKNDRWIILPIDDDDFFHPVVVNKVLEAYESCKCDIVTWRTVLFEAANGNVKLVGQNSVFPSNSYMITNRVAKKVPNDVLNEMISIHAVVKKKSKEYSLKYSKLDSDLSLYSKSPVSFSGTRQKTIVRSAIHDYFASIRNSLINEVQHDMFPWIKPYAKSVNCILQECFL